MAGAYTPSLAPALYYRDPLAALKWLEKAFVFELAMLITDKDGNLGHSQMTYGAGYLMVGSEWADHLRSPLAVDRKNTQTVHIHLGEDLDAHCERARAAGAEIIAEPADQFYGDRTYRCIDPEGHAWTFAQHKVDVTREEAEKASGLNIEGWA